MVSVSEGTMWTSYVLLVFCVMTAFSVSKEKTFYLLVFFVWMCPQSYPSEKLNKKF